MKFPNRDFTLQYISTSYQDVLQQYLPSNTLYILDGLGNVIFTLPSSSIGDSLVTVNMTGSMISASYALTSSYSVNSDSSSYTLNSLNSDFAVLAGEAIHVNTASYSKTASYANFAENIGFRAEYTVASSSITLNSEIPITYINASDGNVTLTVPSAAVLSEKLIFIKKIDSTNNVVYITSSVNLDFNKEYQLTINNNSVILHGDGNQFWLH